MRVLDWDSLAGLCRDLAVRVAQDYDPDVVVGVARVGILPGALIALLLRRDFQSLRMPAPALPATLPPHLPSSQMIAGRRVLLVDEVALNGTVLRWCMDALRRLGAAEVRTLVLFSTPFGVAADYAGPEITATVLQPWVRDTAMVDAAISLRPQ